MGGSRRGTYPRESGCRARAVEAAERTPFEVLLRDRARAPAFRAARERRLSLRLRCGNSKSAADGRDAPGEGGGKKANEPKSGEDKLELAIKLKRRYKNVFSEAVDTTATVEKTAAMAKDEATTAFLVNALRQNFVFASLEEAEVSRIVEYLAKTTVAKGTDLIKQGEQGDFFYIVEEGKFDFIVKGKMVGSCAKGGSFGELALLYGAPRAATVRAMGPAVIWQLDRAFPRGFFRGCRIPGGTIFYGAFFRSRSLALPTFFPRVLFSRRDVP